MSNITIYRFALDMTPGGVTPVVHLSQYDEAFQLEFTLYSRSGELDIPSGATAMIEGTKLDGKAYSANATISGNVVTVAGDVQISAVAGNNPFQIVLKSGNSTVGSANFTIAVERAAMDYDTVSDSKLAQIQDVTATAAQLTAAAENVTDGVETFEALAESVSDMLENIVDDTLSISGKAADAAAVGNALAAEIAPKYSTSATYAVGDYVLYNNVLYRCNTAITTAESWTAAHWTAVKVGSELSNLKSDLDSYKSTERVNIFNPVFLLDAGWTFTNGMYSGFLPALNSAFWANGQGYPISFKPNTQYTFMCEAYHDGEPVSDSNGLIVILKYTDGTTDSVFLFFPNVTVSPSTRINVSAPNKSIASLHLSYGTNSGDVWAIKRFQISEGIGIPYDFSYDFMEDKLSRYAFRRIEDKFAFGKQNLFDPSYLATMCNWTKVSENEYSGTALDLTRVFASTPYPIKFEVGKQYAITMEAYHEGERIVGSYGLDFSFKYSDGTVGSRDCAFENTRIAWTRKTKLSDPSKTVVGLVTPSSISYNTLIWHVRNIMVIEGSDPNQYHPHVTIEKEPEPYIDASVISPGGKGGSVGTGILFRFPNGQRMLMDTHVSGYGVWNEGDGGFTRELRSRSMTTNSLRFDYILLSHYHIDHVGGLIDWIDSGWLSNGKIDIYGATVFLPPEITSANLQNVRGENIDSLLERQSKIINALQAQNCTIIRPTEGQQVLIGDVVITFVNCNHLIYHPGGDYESTNYNDFSLCAYIEYGTETFFYTADLGPISEEYLSTLPSSLLKSTFMTAPHHGWQASGNNLSGANALYPDFINMVSPDVVLSPNGDVHKPNSGNAPSMFGPESAVQSWCEKTGIPNYATCLNGTIDLKLYKHGWKFGGSYIRYIRNNKNWKYSDNSEFIEN